MVMKRAADAGGKGDDEKRVASLQAYAADGESIARRWTGRQLGHSAGRAVRCHNAGATRYCVFSRWRLQSAYYVNENPRRR
jgi:hypothetical protein